MENSRRADRDILLWIQNHIFEETGMLRFSGRLVTALGNLGILWVAVCAILWFMPAIQKNSGGSADFACFMHRYHKSDSETDFSQGKALRHARGIGSSDPASERPVVSVRAYRSLVLLCRRVSAEVACTVGASVCLSRCAYRLFEDVPRCALSDRYRSRSGVGIFCAICSSCLIPG